VSYIRVPVVLNKSIAVSMKIGDAIKAQTDITLLNKLTRKIARDIVSKLRFKETDFFAGQIVELELHGDYINFLFVYGTKKIKMIKVR
jgi:hypothetical protein